MISVKQLSTKQSKTSLGKFIRALFSKETPTYIKAIVGLAVGYTLFPIDALPDVLGVLGYADDAAVIALLTNIAMTLLDNHNNNQAEEIARDFETVDHE